MRYKTSLASILEEELGLQGQDLHPPSVKEVELESHTAAALCQGSKKKKRDLIAAFYDVQKASLESSHNELCRVPGRLLWQEGEHFMLYFLITV